MTSNQPGMGNGSGIPWDLRPETWDWDWDWISLDAWDWDKYRWDSPGTKISGTAKSQALGTLGTLVPWDPLGFRGTKILVTGSHVSCPSLESTLLIVWNFEGALKLILIGIETSGACVESRGKIIMKFLGWVRRKKVKLNEYFSISDAIRFALPSRLSTNFDPNFLQISNNKLYVFLRHCVYLLFWDLICGEVWSSSQISKIGFIFTGNKLEIKLRIKRNIHNKP